MKDTANPNKIAQPIAVRSMRLIGQLRQETEFLFRGYLFACTYQKQTEPQNLDIFLLHLCILRKKCAPNAT